MIIAFILEGVLRIASAPLWAPWLIQKWALNYVKRTAVSLIGRFPNGARCFSPEIGSTEISFELGIKVLLSSFSQSGLLLIGVRPTILVAAAR